MRPRYGLDLPVTIGFVAALARHFMDLIVEEVPA